MSIEQKNSINEIQRSPNFSKQLDAININQIIGNIQIKEEDD